MLVFEKYVCLVSTRRHFQRYRSSCCILLCTPKHSKPLRRSLKKSKKHAARASVSLKTTNTPTILVENHSCAPLGPLLVGLSFVCFFSDAFWALLGLFLASLGRFLGLFGRIFEPSWAHLGSRLASWAHLEPLVASLSSS